jgi:hypothetical protein
VTGWAHEDDIGKRHIALDPERGRVLLGADWAADHLESPISAIFHYGFSRDIGGGDYERVPADVADLAAPQLTVSAAALAPQLATLATAGGRLIIEDDLTYAGTPTFQVPAGGTEQGVTVVVGAANGARPVIAAAGDITLDIGANGTLILDGLVISGGALKLPAAVDNEKRTLVLRDCTLVPGRTLESDGSPASPGAPSLIIEHPFTELRLERCITGPLRTLADAAARATLTNCIVDAAGDARIAYGGLDAATHGAEVELEECTVIGVLDTELLRLGSDCIFTAPLKVARRQEGCLRFSYVPEGSVSPRRFHCLPDAAHSNAIPQFTSLRYADPGYCQLRGATDRAIREGAHDGGEMGVMHALHQPQRETNLRIRLDEYLRFGLRAGLFYAT